LVAGASHRYTCWIEWSTRKGIADEFYDYTTCPSPSREGAFWIEHQNLANEPAQVALRADLSQKLDQMLAQRITVKHDAESTPTKKRKKKQP
jgi:hypothetical protein